MGWRATALPCPPPMLGHLDVVEGLSLPAGYRRGDIARGGDQEPGDRFYSLTTFFLSPNAFSWCACPLGLHAFIHFLSLLPCLLGRCSVRDIVDQGRPRIVHCEYAMLCALGFTPRRARGKFMCGARARPGLGFAVLWGVQRVRRFCGINLHKR